MHRSLHLNPRVDPVLSDLGWSCTLYRMFTRFGIYKIIRALLGWSCGVGVEALAWGEGYRLFARFGVYRALGWTCSFGV